MFFLIFRKSNEAFTNISKQDLEGIQNISSMYKNGELKIFEPRNRAEKERREKPNILDCHDVVREDGAVFLDILERHVNYYMKSNAN